MLQAMRLSSVWPNNFQYHSQSAAASATAVWGGSKNLNPRNPPNPVSINKIHPLQRNEIHFYEAKTNYRNSIH